MAISTTRLAASPTAPTLPWYAFNIHPFFFKEWDKLVYTHNDAQMVDFLQFGFPVGYEGPMPTPSSANHPSVNNHLND